MCILFVCVLLKRFSRYDWSLMPMSMMGCQKKKLDRGWVGSIQFFFFILLCKALGRQRILTIFVN